MDLGFDLSEIAEFNWDTGNLEHIKKHKVEYTECEEIFQNNPLLINQDETHSQIEVRYRAYGQTNQGRELVVIFTIRNNRIRIVSARDQTKRERGEFRVVGGENI